MGIHSGWSRLNAENTVGLFQVNAMEERHEFITTLS